MDRFAEAKFSDWGYKFLIPNFKAEKYTFERVLKAG